MLKFKHIFPLIILVAAPTILLGQGINFFKGTYEEAKAKAVQEKKSIFVDVYTSWCGPCKKMAKEVFPRKEVGDYFNKNFISLQLDAEKEKDHDFFKSFKASAFPTYFWVSAEGELLSTYTSATEADIFIDLAKKALQSKLGQKEKILKQRWDNGERSVAIVNEFVLGILPSTKPELVGTYLEEYLTSLTDDQLKSRENYYFLKISLNSRTLTKGRILDLILKNTDTFQQYEIFPAFQNMLYRKLIRLGNAALATNDSITYRNHIETFKSLDFPNKLMYQEILDMEKSLQTKDYEVGLTKMMSISEKYSIENPFLPKEFFYSIISAGYFKNTTFPEGRLKEIIALAEKAVEFTPSRETVLYLGLAYEKTGDYKKAFDVLATMPFYKDPILSGMLYSFIGLKPSLTTEFGQTEKCKETKAALNAKELERSKNLRSMR